MSKKLYKVVCRGMTGGAGRAHGVTYVVAENPDEAYCIVRAALDQRNLGFRGDREMRSIELLAEQTAYPDCGTTLYLQSTGCEAGG